MMQDFKITNVDKLFGAILIHNNEISRDIFSKIQQSWMVLQVHKDLYKSVNELYNENSDIDVLTVTQKLRDIKTFKMSYVLRMSKVTSDVGYLNIESILNICEYEYKVREMQVIARDFSQEVNNDQMSIDTCVEFSDKIKNVSLFNEIKKNETNGEIILDVVDRHNKAKNGIPLGLQLGFGCTKDIIILEDVDVMVVGGRPAMGKTAWMVSAMKKMAFDQNKRVGIMSLEMSSQQIMRRLIAHLTGIDSNKIKLGKCSDDEIAQIFAVQNLPEMENIVIFDGSMTVMDITRNITEMKNDGGCDVYVVDYLQKIIPVKTENRYTEVTRISNDIKRLTMALKIPCIALAQLSRDSAKAGKRPSLPDLKESGEIEQDASIVAFLHRPEYYGENNDENGDSTQGKGEFLVAKNREGTIGIIEMDVEFTTSTWSDPASNWNEENKPSPEYTQQSLNQFAPTDENPF